MNVARLLAKILKKAGSDTVFGIPSYVGMGILQGLKEEQFNFQINSHEQNAVHAAEGYFYAVGKLPIVSVAIGPGITNAITGISNAYVESVPMVIVIARAATQMIGRNEYHSNSGIGRNLDERQLLKSCTKQIFYIDSELHAEHLINDAIRTAISGRPGPVCISIPFDLQSKKVVNSRLDKSIKCLVNPTTKVGKEGVKEFENLFNKKKKPLFIFGSELNLSLKRDLKELLIDNCPYFTSYGAKGKVPILSNYLGTCWYANSRNIIEAVRESDLVIAVGEHFTHFTIRPFKSLLIGKDVVQISNYSEEIERATDLRLGLVGDVGSFLKEINVVKKPWNPKLTKLKINNNKYNTLNVVSQIGKLSPKNSVFFADVGNAGYSAITNLSLKNEQEFFTTGKFGVCGYSVPAAIGYSYGNKNRPVFSVVGDLSFNMNIQELINVNKLRTNNTFIVFNNLVPQNITMDQIDQLGTTIQSDMGKVDYSGLAIGYGLKYVKIDSMNSLKSFFKNANFAENQYLVEVIVLKDDYPLDS